VESELWVRLVLSSKKQVVKNKLVKLSSQIAGGVDMLSTEAAFRWRLDKLIFWNTIISNSHFNNKPIIMAKATIKSKTGAMITIEGTEKEVSNIIAQFERGIITGRTKVKPSKVAILKKEQKKNRTISDLVIELKEEGFFEKPKNLTEIMNTLEEKGHICPITTLSGVMMGIVQKKLLRRKKVDGKWVYGK